MKIFAIHDKDLKKSKIVGYLFYYEKAKQFIIELCEDIDEWEAPILFQKMVRDGRYTVPSRFSILWVRERIVPSDRQNIGAILRNAKMTEYDEMSLLWINRGRCIQDNCYIKQVKYEDLPDYIQKRMEQRLVDCFVAEDNSIVCMFKDDTVRSLAPSELMGENTREIGYLINNNALLQTATIGVGGNAITFDGQIEIDVYDVIKYSKLLPIRMRDFIKFVKNNIVDTSKVCDMLQCSRQNLSYLSEKGKLEPIAYGTKERLYSKGAVVSLMND